MITNQAGTITETIDYTPFGEVRLDSGTTNTGRKYIGEIYDQSSSLSYLNARYYSGSQSKFLSQDPIFTGDPNKQQLTNPQSLNSYSYAEGNPVTKNDPTGLWAVGWTIFSVGGEGGLGIFGGATLNVSINYVRNSQTGESWIAPSITFGATAGAGSKSVNYPNTVHYPPAPSDAPSGIMGLHGGVTAFTGASISPSAKSPDDIRGVTSNSSLNVPAISFSVQQDNKGGATFSAGPGLKAYGSVSNYPVKTWVPFAVNASPIDSAVGNTGSSYRAALNGIQSKINYLRSEVSKMGAARSDVQQRNP